MDVAASRPTGGAGRTAALLTVPVVGLVILVAAVTESALTATHRQQLAIATDRRSRLSTVSGVLDRAAIHRRNRAAWVVMITLAVGVGLIAMHAGSSRPERSHGNGHSHDVVAMAMGEDAVHAAPCEGCTSHSSMTMVCAVLLAAVAGRAAFRLVRRLVAPARLVPVPLALAVSWLRTATSRLGRPPDLHALQVMRC